MLTGYAYDVVAVHVIQGRTRSELEQAANRIPGVFRVRALGETWRKIGGEWVVIPQTRLTTD